MTTTPNYNLVIPSYSPLTAEQRAVLYASRSYYQRERHSRYRFRRGRAGPLGRRHFLGGLENRPGRSDRLLYNEGRRDFLDVAQGINGYFFGGGWTFGLVENGGLRIHTDSLYDYIGLNPNTGEVLLTIKFEYGDTSQPLLGTRVVNTDNRDDSFEYTQLFGYLQDGPPENGYYILEVDVLVGGTDDGTGRVNLPFLSQLDPLDWGAVFHDAGLQAARRYRDGRATAQDLAFLGDNFDLPELNGITIENQINRWLADHLTSIDWDAEAAAVAESGLSWIEKQRALGHVAYNQAMAEFSALGLYGVFGAEVIEDFMGGTFGDGDEASKDLYKWISEVRVEGLDAEMSEALLDAVDGRAAQILDDLLEDYEKTGLHYDALANSTLAEIGGVFGSILGSTLAGGQGRFDDSVKSFVLSSIGAQLGAHLGAGFETGNVLFAIEEGFTDVLQNLDQTLISSVQSAGVGFISSMLVTEFVEAVGIDGVAGELVGEVMGATLNQFIFEAVGWADLGIANSEIITELGSIQTVGWNAVSSYLGRRLADEVVEPTNTFSAVASNVMGARAAASTFKYTFASTGNVFIAAAAATVVAFVETVIWRLFGNLFGSRKPKIPTADAETVLNFGTGYYELGAVNAQNGGNEDLVQDMALAARDTLNGLISTVTYGAEIAGNANANSPTQVYGHTGGQLWVKLGGTGAAKQNVDSADEAVDKGALWAIERTEIVGGNLFMKRAIASSTAKSILGLAGDLQVAEDYGFYLRHENVMKSLLSEPYRSLTQTDRNFYDQYEDEFTRYSAAPKDENGDLLNEGHPHDLTGADLTWYTNHSTQIRAIADQLTVSQFAAGWIITLQRAAELGLNETSKSDFYGGVKGLLDSLQIQADRPVYVEDTSISLDGDTMHVGFGAHLGPDANLMLGGDLSIGTSLLQNTHDYNGGATSQTFEKLDDGEALVFRDSGTFHSWSSGTLVATRHELHGGDIDSGRHFTVNGAEYVTIGFEAKQLGDSRNRVYMYVGFYNEAGSRVGWHALSNGNSTSWQRKTKTVQATADTIEARVYIYTYARVGSTGGTPTTLDVAARSFQFNRSQTAVASAPDFTVPAFERFSLNDVFNKADFNLMTNTPGTAASDEAIWLVRQQSTGYTDVEVDGFISWTGGDNTGGNDVYIYEGSTNQIVKDTHTERLWVTEEEFDPWDPDFYLFDRYQDDIVITGGDDIFITGSGDDELWGYDGDDWLSGGDGADTIYGQNGDDVIIGGNGDDALYGGAGDDYIHGGFGVDWTRGQDGNDTLTISLGGGATMGEAGNDTFIVTGGEFGYYGWARGGYGSDDNGSDTLSYERIDRGISLDMNYRPTSWDGHSSPTYAHANTRRFRTYDYVDGVTVTSAMIDIYAAQIDNVTGTQFADFILGDAQANVLRGLGGDDILTGGAGNDELEGGAGADTLDGGSGGYDILSYKHSDGAVWVDLTSGDAFGGDATGDTFSNFSDLRGSDFDDTLFGRNAVNGTLYGERGNDWFVASTNRDTIYGGEGFDTVDYGDATGNVNVNLNTGYGYWSATTDRYYSIEHAVGSDFNDTMTGSAGDDFFQGGKGNDTLSGGAGMDTYIFNRGDGRDTIYESDVDQGYDTLVFGDGVTWNDLIWSTTNGDLIIGLRDSTSNTSAMNAADRVIASQSFANLQNQGGGIDAVDVGGLGVIDIDQINYAIGGWDGSDTILGLDQAIHGSRRDLLLGYAGNDVIYGSHINGNFAWEDDDNVIIAGRGDDQIWTSVGDDQFVFDRGDGRDTIYESGGIDRIQFGTGVAAEDIIFRVHNGDLYIGLREEANPDLAAHEVADYIRVVGGSVNDPKIEHISAGGIEIDLRKIDLTPPPLPNTAPTDIIKAAGGNVNEGASNGTFVADFNATDAEGGTLTFSLTNTAGGRFAINASNGVVTVANGSLLDYETNTSHVIGVRVTDSGGLSRDENHTITVNDVAEGGGANQAPNAVNDFATAEFLGSTAVTFIAPLFNDTDPDGDTLNVHSFTQTSFGTLTRSGNNFSFEASSLYSGMTTSFTYTVSDGNGGFDTATVTIDIGEHSGGGGFLFPVVIDLDGDGADFISVHQSRVVMQRNESGLLARMGWVSADDGLLALDRDGDGLINRVDEISFVGDLEGAQTDLEGLQAFDTNGDGKLTAADDRWGDFTVWQDANENGFGSVGEQRTLDEIGITEISLKRTPTGKTLSGNEDTVVLNTTEVTFADGTVAEGYDTAFRLELARETGKRANLEGVDFKGEAHAGKGKLGVALAEGGVLADLYHHRTEADLEGSAFGLGSRLDLFVDVEDALAAPDPTGRYKFDPVTQTFGVAPIVVDMDGDGVELLDPGQSPILGDFNGDGIEDRLGWANADDAFLAFDRNADGLINGINEISFLEDLPGAETDLQGLRAFDSNGNGLFDSGDAKYASFSLWQDRNYDGLGSADELISLADAGFESIGLGYTDAAPGVVTLFNIVHGQAEVAWSDGTTGYAGDISLQGFAGIADEQALNAFYRNDNASGRNAWGFDRYARRSAIQELERQSYAGSSEASAPHMRSNLSDMVERRDLAFGASIPELSDAPMPDVFAPLRLDPVAKPSGEPVTASNLPNTSSNAVTHVEPLGAQSRASRWWVAALEGQNRARRGFGSLAQTLSQLDSERQAITPGRAEAQPAQEASVLAEQQRLLQAMASFRGASGAPVLSRNDANDLTGRASMLAPGRFGDGANLR